MTKNPKDETVRCQELTATFKVLGHNVVLSETECRNAKATIDNMLRKASESLNTKLGKLSEEERTNVLADLLLEVDIKLDTPSTYFDEVSGKYFRRGIPTK